MVHYMTRSVSNYPGVDKSVALVARASRFHVWASSLFVCLFLFIVVQQAKRFNNQEKKKKKKRRRGFHLIPAFPLMIIAYPWSWCCSPMFWTVLINQFMMCPFLSTRRRRRRKIAWICRILDSGQNTKMCSGQNWIDSTQHRLRPQKHENSTSPSF